MEGLGHLGQTQTHLSGGRGKGSGCEGRLAAQQTQTPWNLRKDGPESSSLIYSGASPEILMKHIDSQSLTGWGENGEPLAWKSGLPAGSLFQFRPAAHHCPLVAAKPNYRLNHLPPRAPQGHFSRSQPSPTYLRTLASAPSCSRTPPGVSRASLCRVCTIRPLRTQPPVILVCCFWTYSPYPWTSPTPRTRFVE